MKKIIAIAVVAFALAGCETLKTGTERAAIGPMTIGEPKIVLSQTGLLVVDQEPLLLRGRNSVTWTLPADNAKYQDFAVTIDAATKRIVREGKVVTFRPLDGPKINQSLKCGQVDGNKVTCELPTDLVKKLVRDTAYSYTVRFRRNGVPFELDPTVWPSEF
jgi:hypothetical protein